MTVGLVIGFTTLHAYATRYYTSQITITHRLNVPSRCLIEASNGGRSPSAGFINYPRPQLPASNSNSSQ
jgi:hypothetical protein